MQAVFGLKREQYDRLYFKEYTNDSGIFHFHSSIELYFVDDGEMEVTVNQHKRTLRKGEMSVALGFDAHAYRTPEYSSSSVLIIPQYLCESFVAAVKNKRATQPFICDPAVVAKIKECFAQIKRVGNNTVALHGYIYVILGTVMEHIGLKEAGEYHDPQLSARLLLYINDHYREELTLGTLSAAFGYSREHLSRYFKESIHIGLQRYVNIVRLKNALSLMHERTYSITYCALESGFPSLRTFYRAFSREFGCSPKEYLLRLQSAD